MHDIESWLSAWERDHRDPRNRRIQVVCAPAVLLGLVGLAWLIPVPAMIGKPGLWAAAAMVLAFAWYQRLSRPIAYAMALVFIGFGVICFAACGALGAHRFGWLALALLALAWIGQAIGDALEGHRPTAPLALAYVLIGPAWCAAQLLRRFGIRP